MKIGFDARMASHPGIGRYMSSLLTACLDDPSTDLSWKLIGDPNQLGQFTKYTNVEIVECGIPIYSMAEQFNIHKYYDDVDLVHIPHFNTPWTLPKKCVVTIHDLIYLSFSEYSPFPGAQHVLKYKLHRIAKQAEAVIAVSEATKNECASMFSQMKSKIKVVYEASEPGLNQLSDEKASALREGLEPPLTEPYFLSVGSIREHKHVHTLISAYEMLQKKDEALPNLVIAGRLDERFDKKHHFREKVSNNSGIIHVSDLNDHLLNALYKGALAFVMPSVYEGFGLPVLEAMSHGTPVITSDAQSLVEVGGEASLVFERGQIDALSCLLYNVLKDKDLRQNLSQKGLQQVRKFSWKLAATQTQEIYQEILSK